MLNYHLQSQFAHGLKKKREELGPSARTLGKKECVRCTVPCWLKPGRMTKTDVPVLAQHLGITVQEFFSKYCVIDYDKLPDFTLRLRREHQTWTAGRVIDADDTWSIASPCVFLDTKKKVCTVHDAKPTECADYKCWDAVPEAEQKHGTSWYQKFVWTEAELKELGWEGGYP